MSNASTPGACFAVPSECDPTSGAGYGGGMRLILIRHGRTRSNVEALLDTAIPGADLDDVGRSQAERLVKTLADEEIEGLFASDLVRTQQTAAPLARERGLETEILGGLREIQAGDQEMAPNWDLYIEVLRSWGTGRFDVSRPGGDTFHGFFSRFDEAVGSIAEAGHEVAALVSHGAALRAWTGRRVMDLTPYDTAVRVLGNTGTITLEGDPYDGWRLAGWRDGIPTDAPGSAAAAPVSRKD